MSLSPTPPAGRIRTALALIALLPTTSGASSLAPAIRVVASIEDDRLLVVVENTSKKALTLEAQPALVLAPPDWESTHEARRFAFVNLVTGRSLAPDTRVHLRLRPGRPVSYRFPLGAFGWGEEGGGTEWPARSLKELAQPGRYTFFVSIAGVGSDHLAVDVDSSGYIALVGK